MATRKTSELASSGVVNTVQPLSASTTTTINFSVSRFGSAQQFAGHEIAKVQLFFLAISDIFTIDTAHTHTLVT